MMPIVSRNALASVTFGTCPVNRPISPIQCLAFVALYEPSTLTL